MYTPFVESQRSGNVQKKELDNVRVLGQKKRPDLICTGTLVI